MRGFLVVSALAVLAACSEAPIPTEPDNGIGDGATPLNEEQGVPRSDIPEKFHGVWDAMSGTCARESDLRMDISASEIMFYESIGTVSSVEEFETYAHVTLTMEGEGETWEQTYLLALAENAPFLTATDVSNVDDDPNTPDLVVTPILRKKCSE